MSSWGGMSILQSEKVAVVRGEFNQEATETLYSTSKGKVLMTFRPLPHGSYTQMEMSPEVAERTAEHLMFQARSARAWAEKQKGG